MDEQAFIEENAPKVQERIDTIISLLRASGIPYDGITILALKALGETGYELLLKGMEELIGVQSQRSA